MRKVLFLFCGIVLFSISCVGVNKKYGHNMRPLHCSENKAYTVVCLDGKCHSYCVKKRNLAKK